MEASIPGCDSCDVLVKCEPCLRVAGQLEHLIEHVPAAEWVTKGTAYQAGYALVFFLSLWKWVVLHWNFMMNSKLKREHLFIQNYTQSSHSSPDSEDTLSSPECDYAVSSEEDELEPDLEHRRRREAARRWPRRPNGTPETSAEHLTREATKKKPETRTGRFKRRTELNKANAAHEKRRKLSEIAKDSCDSDSDSEGTGRLVIAIPSDSLSD